MGKGKESPHRPFLQKSAKAEMRKPGGNRIPSRADHTGEPARPQANTWSLELLGNDLGKVPSGAVKETARAQESGSRMTPLCLSRVGELMGKRMQKTSATYFKSLPNDGYKGE